MTEAAPTNPSERGAARPVLAGGRLLGLRVRRREALVDRVRAGFTFSQLTRLEQRTGLTREEFAALVAIPPRTLARRRQRGRLTPDESDRLLRAARVFEMVEELFEGETEEARRWLRTANPALGGRTPLHFASTDVGAREVENLIGRLEHGVFA